MEQCFKQKSSFRTIRIILFSLSMLFAYATNGYAQNMVRGVVTDVTGDPLPGVSVVVKGTTTGTTTDIDGRYSINASNTATLEWNTKESSLNRICSHGISKRYVENNCQ